MSACKLGLVFGAAAAAAVLTAGSAAAADPVNPTVTSDDGTYTLVLHSHTVKESFIPKGGTPTSEEPKGEPEPGDAFGFFEELTQHGTVVGHDKGVCTITGPKAVACKVAVSFPNGTFAVEGEPEFSEDGSVPAEFRVVGGTGAYAGAKGTALVKDSSDTDSDITVTYTLGGGQVSEVPTGGAETGDGSTAGTESPWLLGLGAAAAVSGAAVFAGSARRARRSS
jgi:hypothetical protein